MASLSGGNARQVKTILFGMAGSRTHARGFQPIPSVTEKCYSFRLFRRTVPEPSLAMPTISDPSVTKCDMKRALVDHSLWATGTSSGARKSLDR